MKKKTIPGCLKGKCRYPRMCSRCGFNAIEAARRKNIPLVKDPRTGLWVKHVEKK